MTPHQKPRVLFVCVHNAGRSQMAAGWLKRLAGGRVEVRSAGSEPADQVNPVGCPVFPGKRYEDWELTEPAGQSIEVVRQVRDDIKNRIEALISEIALTE